MENKKRVGAYVRVSTTMQEEKDSLKTQISKIESYCDLHNYDLYKIYEDVGSGGDDERKGFKELQRDIDSGIINILLVYESSRISRKSATLINFVNTMIEKNVDFVSISQQDLNTTTSTGRLFFTIQAGLGQYERELISKRVKSSAYEKAKKGHWMAGKLPIGYKRDDDRNIIIDEDKKELVLSYFTTFLSNQSLKKTALLFNRHLESLRWILTNPFYTGLYRYGVKNNNLHNKKKTKAETFLLVPGNHPPLITREVFDKVQLYIKSNRVLNKKSIKSSKFILGGLVKCSCNHKMYGNGNYVKKYDRLYRNYQCDHCKKKVDADLLEEYIFSKLKSFEELKEIDEVKISDENLINNLNTYKERKKAIQKEEDRLVSFLLKELITEEQYKKNKIKIQSDLEFVNLEIENIEKTIDKKEHGALNNFEILIEVANNYKSYDIMDLRELLRMIIKEIIITDIKDKSTFNYDVILDY